MNLKESVKQLYELALQAKKNAYAPYSHYRVGAAVRMSDGRVFSGCNVENASLGGSICAERVSIYKAMSEGSKEIEEILVITDSSPPGAPCGFCRQIIAEFATEKTLIHYGNEKGELFSSSFKELLPKAFTLSVLKST